MRTNPAAERSSYRIGVDVGGTFTDLALTRGDGTVAVFKALTVPSEPMNGVLNVLEIAANSEDVSVEGMLNDCTLFMHGTTIATNTLLVRDGAKVGYIGTEGFRDTLEIRRGVRENPWDHRVPFPEVLVPRYLRRTIPARLNRDASVDQDVRREDVVREAKYLIAAGVDSVAVCLHNSFLSDHQEVMVADIIRDVAPQLHVSLSSQIAAEIGEYERGSTAVLNSYVGLRTTTYIRKLNDALLERGLKRNILLIQNNGGAVSVDQVTARPVSLLLSGPAAGAGAVSYFARCAGVENVISMEIGGTSCDLILMGEGVVGYSDALNVDGFHAALPTVDIHTVGTGGGTIAGVTVEGLLSVGPRGAGSSPGPACYGLGGDEPTITDAQLLLGRLHPDSFSKMAPSLNRKLAAETLEKRVAEPLGITTMQAAVGVIRLMEDQLTQAVQKISIEKGCDARKFTLMPGGGAGALHASSVARRLGCDRVYIPRFAGAFCAFGMLNSDVRQDFSEVVFYNLSEVSDAELDGLYSRLAEKAQAVLRQDGFEPSQIVTQRKMDMRYHGQQWTVTVDVPMDANIEVIGVCFAQRHTQLYGHCQDDGIVEITKIGVSGIGKIQQMTVHRLEDSREKAEPSGTREIWLDARTGWAETPLYDGKTLRPGMTIIGPAIINEATTTVLLLSGDLLTVDRSDNYRIDVARKASA